MASIRVPVVPRSHRKPLRIRSARSAPSEQLPSLFIGASMSDLNHDDPEKPGHIVIHIALDSVLQPSEKVAYVWLVSSALVVCAVDDCPLSSYPQAGILIVTQM